MTAIRKGKNGASSIKERAPAKTKNGIGLRFVQRKFAQGVPVPPTQQMVPPPPERKPEPPREDQRNVYHSRMSAMNLLDVIALQKVHLHQQPTVLLERLRQDEFPAQHTPPSSAPPPTPSPAPTPPTPSPVYPKRRVIKTKKFKNKMCLRPRAKLTPRIGRQRKNNIDNMDPRKVRASVGFDDRSSNTEDDMPLLYLRNKARPAYVEHTGTESNFNFKRPLNPSHRQLKMRRRRRREVTPMSWADITATDTRPGELRRSARRPTLRSLSPPAASQRNPRRRTVYLMPPSARRTPSIEFALLEPIGEVSAADHLDPDVSVVECMAPTTCASLAYRSVQDIVTACTGQKHLFGRRCRECIRCVVIEKIVKLTGLVQLAFQNPESIYDFNNDNDPACPSLARLRDMRRVARGQAAATSVYLDIFPKSVPKMIKIENRRAADNTMDTIAFIVDRFNMDNSNVPSFMEQEHLLDALLGSIERHTGQGAQDRKIQVMPHYQEPQVAQESQRAEEPQPSTSRAKIEPRRREPHRDGQQPSTSRANMEPARRREPQRGVRGNQPFQLPKEPLAGTVPVSADAARSPYSDCDMYSNSTTPSKRGSPITWTDGPGCVTEAPTFFPSQEEFADPIAYFKKIEGEAMKYGLCKIVPPLTFKPPCKQLGKFRFSVVYQYISKLYNRWGPSSRELAAIKAYLKFQGMEIKRPPILDSCELSLYKLHHVVERHGGADKVLNRNRWKRVADELKLPTRERRLDQIFMQYLLPYSTLSPQERQVNIAFVEKGWIHRYQKILRRARNPMYKQHRLLGQSLSSDEETEDPATQSALHEAEDCIVPGRLMNLNVFKKVASTLMENHFEGVPKPSPEEVEDEYWRAVVHANDHIVANAASIDTGEEGYGFPNCETMDHGSHPWNLKMLAKHPENVLRYLGSTLGANNPTLHLNMLFSTSCWHGDPHGLPWIEYIHSGAEKIWYGIPSSQSENFRRAVETLCPAFCQNKSIWLASDIAMIPPEILKAYNVKLSRVTQNAGEFILVFPEAHSCSISTGYSVSESVYFATLEWLETASSLFTALRNSCEPSMFSLEKLLIEGVRDPTTPRHLLLPMCSVLSTIISVELENRRLLALRGLRIHEAQPPTTTASRRAWNTAQECEFCRCTLFLSAVLGITGKASAFCTEHAIMLLEKRKYRYVSVPKLEFRTNFRNQDLEAIINKMETRVAEH